MSWEIRNCLIPRAICFNNSSSVIFAVPFLITTQNDNFICNFTMTYLSFRKKCFMFVKSFLFMITQPYLTEKKDTLILRLPQFLLIFCKTS